MRALLLPAALLLTLWTPARAADRTWDGGGDGVTWSDARNWSDDALPGAGDHALIGGSATVRLTDGRSVLRLTLTGTATLSVESTLTVGTGGAVVESGATLRMDAGSPYLTLNGPLAVRGRMEHGHGTLWANTGMQVTLASGASLRLYTGGLKQYQTPILNEGTIRWEDGGFTLVGLPLTNRGTFEIALDTDRDFSLFAGNPVVENTGTLRKTGTGTVNFHGALRTVGGTVDVQAGTFVQHGGSRWENAAVAVAEGATLRLGPSRGENPHVVAGTLSGMPAGAFLLDGNYAYLAADEAGGILDLGGTGLQVGYAQLGTREHVPSRDAPTNRGLVRFVGPEAQIRGGFVNEGTLRWEAGRPILLQGHTLRNVGLLEVAVGADAEWAGAGAGGPLLNTGTIRKTGAATARFTSLDLRTVGGTVDVQGGTLRHEFRSRWEDAAVQVAPDARLHLAGSRQQPNMVVGTLGGAVAGTFLVSGTSLVADSTRGGSLALSGNGIEVNDTYVGTLTTPGRYFAPVNRGTLAFTGGFDLAIEAPFRNEGYVLWSGGTLRVRPGQTVTNSGTFEIGLVRDATMQGPQGSFRNDGRLVKSGPATATFEPLLDLPPGSALDVQEGTLDKRHRSRLERPAITVAAGATFQLGTGTADDRHLIADTLRVDPAGNFGAAGTVAGDPQRPGVLLVGGTGFGLWGVTPLDLDGLRLQNRGLIRINSGRLELPDNVVNHGTIRWESGGQFFIGGGMTFTNLGTFEVTNPAGTLYGGTLDNQGLFRHRSSGVAYPMELVNNGRLEVEGVFPAQGSLFFSPIRLVNGPDGVISGTGTLDLRRATNQAGIVNQGILAPGPGDRGAGIGTLTIWGHAATPLGRVELDVAGPGANEHDRLVLTVPNPRDAFVLGGSAVLRPRAAVRVGDTIHAIEGPVTGTFRGVVSSAPRLGFTAAYDPATGVRFSATEGDAGGTFVAFPEAVVSGDVREFSLTGNTFTPGSTVHLECRSCLDRETQGTIPGYVLALSENDARVWFDLSDGRLFGDYDVVVTPPSGPALRGPVKVVPVYAFPLFTTVHTQGIAVVPDSVTFGGLRWSQWRLFHASNNPGFTYYVVRMAPPASRAVRVRFDAGYSDEDVSHGERRMIWNRATAPDPDEAFFIARIRQDGRALLDVGMGIDPANVDFTQIASAQSDLPFEAFAEAAARGEDAAGTCAPNAPFAARPAGSGSTAPLPFGSEQDFIIEQLRGMVEGQVRGAIEAILLEDVCQRFRTALDAAYPNGVEGTLTRAVTEALREIPPNGVLHLDEVFATVFRKLFEEYPGRRLFDWDEIARGCRREHEGRFRERIRITEKGIVDIQREGTQEGDPNLGQAFEQWADAVVQEAHNRFADAFGYDRDKFREILERGRDETRERPCTPVPPIYDNPRPRIRGPYDPNDKTVPEELACEMGTVVVDGVEQRRCVRYAVPLARNAAPLAYTIHFENKAQATDPARTVVIRDTLDANFDPATLRVTASSADPQLTVTRSGQVVTFTFQDINLPPNRTAPEGQGFVSYTVAPNGPLGNGTVLRNRAAIFFDFNPPIFTPTVEHVIRQVADPVVRVAARDLVGVNRPYRSLWVVRNAGPDAGPNTRLTFTLPPDATLLSATPSLGQCSGTPLTCTFGNLPVGAFATVELVVTPTAVGTLEILGEAASSVANAYPVNSRVRLQAQVATGVAADDDAESRLPTTLVLGPNAPNPFRGATRVRFGLPQPGPVRLSVYDLLGREVLRAVDEPREAGWHEVTLDGAALAAGVYLYRLEAGAQAQTRRLVVVR